MWACIYGNYLPWYVIQVPRKPYLSNHPSHFMSTKFLLIKKMCTYTMYGNSFPLYVKGLEALKVYSIQKNIYVFYIHLDWHCSSWQLITTRCVKNQIVSHICSIICTHMLHLVHSVLFSLSAVMKIIQPTYHNLPQAFFLLHTI